MLQKPKITYNNEISIEIFIMKLAFRKIDMYFFALSHQNTHIPTHTHIRTHAQPKAHTYETKLTTKID